jgi:hypothetical protein
MGAFFCEGSEGIFVRARVKECFYENAFAESVFTEILLREARL